MSILKKRLGIFIVLALSFIIVSRIFHHGFFAAHDDTQPTRIFEMTKSLKDGLFPVRWVSDLGFGYGYPIFNFYAPFPYYVGSLFNIIGFDAITSAKIMYGLAVIAAGVGMYLFIRSFLGELPAVAAAVIYLYFPYFAVNIFVRGAVGEYYAYAILPFIFLGLFKIYYQHKVVIPSEGMHQAVRPEVEESQTTNLQNQHGGMRSLRALSLGRDDKIKWIIFTPIALAALIISHNLSAYMLGIILFFFFLGAIYFGKNKKSLIAKYSITLILAFLLSAFYTIPAVFEINYTDVNSQVSGNFVYSNHFVCPMQWWDSAWGFGGSIKGCVDGISFRLGKTNIIFAAIGIILGIFVRYTGQKRRYTFLFLFSVFFLFFSLFMMSEYSQVIWTILPKIEFLQFPWRFLNFAGLALSILIGFLVYFLNVISTQNSKIPPTIAGAGLQPGPEHSIASYKLAPAGIAVALSTFIIIISTLYVNLKLFTPQNYNNRASVYYTDKNQITFAISKITNEYMPEGFVRPTNSNQVPKYPLKIIKGTGRIKIARNKTGTLHAFIQINTDGEIHINKAYFPAWNLIIDAKEHTLKKVSQGMILTLPSGNHAILLQLTQTPIENFANALTLISSLALFIGIITYVYAKKTT